MAGGSGFGRPGWPVGQLAQFEAANHFSANFFSTVVGRFGYEVSGNFLPFVTAGLIMGGASMDTAITGSIPGRVVAQYSDLPSRGGGGVGGVWGGLGSHIVYGANSLDQMRTGLTAGGGFEYSLTRNWSLQLDYKYFAFPKLTLYTPAYANGVQVTSFRLSEKGWGNILSLGANYHF